MAKKKNLEDEVEEALEEERINQDCKFDKMISTGSTQLDLAISGKRVRGGGIPGGIIVEISGPSSVGKTAILSEIIASCQFQGGEAKLVDPEARFDAEFSRIYGMEFDQCKYTRPDTVSQMFSELWNWKPKPKSENAICVFAADSLAALSTEVEMEEGDKYGMKRAKEFSEGLRKTARIIANNNWLIPCTNQERESPTGLVTPGGKGIPYYASLRMRLSKPMKDSKIKRTSTINGVKHEKIDGIRTVVKIIKNSLDEPFRECKFSLVFNVGIDNVRDNLEFLRDNRKQDKFVVFDQEFARADKAIQYVEDNNLEFELENQVIDLWEEIQNAFVIERKRKIRK